MNYARIVAVSGLVLAFAGCGGAADLSCEEIAEQATNLSKSQPVQITSISNLQEVSKDDKERRCSGVAQTSLGTNEAVVLKGYEDAEGNQMVSYEGQGAIQ